MTISAEELTTRLFARDATLWAPGNVSVNRLGWLDVPRTMERETRDLRSWAGSIDEETVIILGMGGSSLGPAVLESVARSFSSPQGRRVLVCDTTDPSTIEAMPFEEAFILVSSKSGTTLEPNVLFAYARTRQKDLRKYALITDPSTPLAALGERLGVNRIFLNTPDIGGRYSVLSYFGVVPAVLAGYDIEELCGRALEVDRHEAVTLGVAMATAALEGEDKATLEVDESVRSFGLWVEQLIAESTGKLGRGVIPVPTTEHETGSDRFTIPVEIATAHELGAAFYRFELATAAAGHVLAIDPFDEPNVAESKANTNTVLENLPLPAIATANPDAVAGFLANEVREGDYVCVQAYLPYGADDKLEALRRKIRDDHGVAVTAGYGPRFLHSTGQLHKGGPNSVICLQIVTRSPQPELAIPDERYDFATLIAAQSIGDYQSLRAHDRRVLRVELDDLGELL